MGATRQYDAGPAQTQQVIAYSPNNTGITVPGTAAADTVLLRILVTHPIRIKGTAQIRLITGGTAAGPTITFGKSLAGTGTVAAFGTNAFGTSANGAQATVALTETTLDAGDNIVVSNLAGTAASSPVIIFSIPFNQAFA